MEVVMGGSRVSDGCEVCVVVELWLYWTTIVVVAEFVVEVGYRCY